MLTSSLNWLPDHCTPQRMAFKVIVNTKAVLSLGFAKAFSDYCSKTLLEHGYAYMYCQLHSCICVPLTIQF